jgi:hypothetical protein
MAKAHPRVFITHAITSPPLLHAPIQCNRFVSGETLKLGVLSS